MIGQEKGEDLETRIDRNFGMMRPEGYRKTIRLMNLANKFRIPIVVFTIHQSISRCWCRERGQAEAIARSIECSMDLNVPTVSIIIGEGGSGGAIALASSNKVLMLENAIYSVISPEGCATILWRDPKKTLEASEAMKMSAKDLLKLDIIDEIIPEPTGGAHRDRDLILDNVRGSLRKNLNYFSNMSNDEILAHRKNKFLSIGRSKGFVSNKNNSENLVMKMTLIDKIKFNLTKNKNIIYFIPILLILIMIIFLVL